MSFRTLKTQLTLLALLFVCALNVPAQQTAPKPATPIPPAAPPQSAAAPAPPQVLTVVHRLSGLKLLRWLNRSGSPVAAVVEYDESNPLASDMHTSITAGFALNDGHSIVASLPQAEAEVLAPVAVAAETTPVAKGTKTDKAPVASMPDLMVMRTDGFKFAADYVGLDGLTGLSLLRIEGAELPSIPDALEETLAVGQRVRLYAPAPAMQSDTKPLTNLFLRMGEIEGRLANIARTSTGRVALLTVSASNLSPAINGGVALNDAGETVGIVQASSRTEARILPAQVIRRAAERVLARRASVPRPLLGVSGRAVEAASLFQFTSGGWSQAEAAALMGQGQGLLLTAVAPRSPAALADLRPGDIIVRVNEAEVRNAEDFSFMLSEATIDTPVMFTILRGQSTAQPTPGALPAGAAPPAPLASAMPPINLEPFNLPKLLKSLKPIAISVKLNFSFKMEMPNFPPFPLAPPAPPGARGIETIALAAAPDVRRAGHRGVLVVSVSPASEASRAGLREGDIIEAVNGNQLTSAAQTRKLLSSNASLSLSIIRNGQKLTINLPDN